MVNMERHARHLLLPEVGVEGQQRLASASVLIVGAGGLGSPVALYLAAAGVGRIGLIDDDVVDISNLQRQIIHTTADVGRRKVDSAQETLLALDPAVNLEVHPFRLTPHNAMEVLSNGWDVVVDGTDNLPTRYLIDDACHLLNIPWVYGSIYRFEGQVSLFGHQDGPVYRDLFPHPPPPDAVLSCEEAGVLGVLPGLVGTLQATEAIKLVLGHDVSLSGVLLVIDTMTMDFQKLKFGIDPDRVGIVDLSLVRSMLDDPEWCRPPSPSSSPQTSSPTVIDRPPMVQSVSMQELLARRTNGWAPFVLDVRSNEEHQAARVNSCGFHVPHTDVAEALDRLPKEGDILVHCRSGMRSQMAILTLVQCGVPAERLYNLSDGIMGWASLKPDEIIQ